MKLAVFTDEASQAAPLTPVRRSSTGVVPTFTTSLRPSGRVNTSNNQSV